MAGLPFVTLVEAFRIEHSGLAATEIASGVLARCHQPSQRSKLRCVVLGVVGWLPHEDSLAELFRLARCIWGEPTDHCIDPLIGLAANVETVLVPVNTVTQASCHQRTAPSDTRRWNRCVAPLTQRSSAASR
jgi:hypothetical protein